jgi:hypothetical protein
MERDSKVSVFAVTDFIENSIDARTLSTVKNCIFFALMASENVEEEITMRHQAARQPGTDHIRKNIGRR